MALCLPPEIAPTNLWPGDGEPSTLQCKDCHEPYQTLNPRTSERCPQCARKRRTQASRDNYRKRKLRRMAA